MFWTNIIAAGTILAITAAAPTEEFADNTDFEEGSADFSADFSACGRSNNVVDLRVINDDARTVLGPSNHAKLGEFPHMCVIFYTKDGSNVYVGGASLIQTNLLITLASAVRKFTGHISDRETQGLDDNDEPDVDLRDTDSDRTCKHEWKPKAEMFVRCGDIRIQAENKEEITKEVEMILLHPEYSDTHLVNDIAVLVLKEEYKFSAHIGRVCLPSPGRDGLDAIECVATGHGKDNFGAFGYYSETLRKVELPLVTNKKCQQILNEEHFKNTSIKTWDMDESFICAGGQAGKDTCEGDGGSPLVCYLPLEEDINLRNTEQENQYTQVGVVAWGIECGRAIPAVYTKVAHPPVRCWLDQVLACHGNGPVDLRNQEITINLRSDGRKKRSTEDVIEGCEDWAARTEGAAACCGQEDEEEYEYDYDQRISLRDDSE